MPADSARPRRTAAAASISFEPAAVVREVRRTIAEHYVLPERQPALDAALADGLKSGRYDVRDRALLAARIDADLRRVGDDEHLNFACDPGRFAAMTAGSAGSEPDPHVFEEEVRRRNHGVRELRLLAGNVRYLDLAAFDWIGEESESALNAAMAFLKGGDAVVIDVRRNGGGNGRAVHQIVSHFMEAERPLIRFYRGSDASPMFTTLSGLSNMVGKPLYVLTSAATGSAAEEFVGHVAGFGLGEVVGAGTSGAAYMNGFFAIAPAFVLSVSLARPVLAATGGDWERAGIAPTIAVPVEAALETAHLHALRRLAADGDAAERARLNAIARGVAALKRPGTPSAPLPAYRGRYGDRRIALDRGRLSYRQGREPPRLMVSLGGHRFTLADDPLQRLVFHAEGARIHAFDLGPATGAPRARHERTR